MRALKKTEKFIVLGQLEREIGRGAEEQDRIRSSFKHRIGNVYWIYYEVCTKHFSNAIRVYELVSKVCFTQSSLVLCYVHMYPPSEKGPSSTWQLMQSENQHLTRGDLETVSLRAPIWIFTGCVMLTVSRFYKAA